MPAVTIKNIPEPVHRAIRLCAAQNCRGVEAELHMTLEAAAYPPNRLKLGSMLVETNREAALTDAAWAVIDRARDRAPARAVEFG